MKLRFVLVILPLLFLFFSRSAYAELYRVTVTRKAQDFYLENNTGLLIKTFACYEYVYFEEAVLDWNGAYGRLIFIDSGGAECDVERIFK
jgi:hypothetical protein